MRGGAASANRSHSNDAEARLRPSDDSRIRQQCRARSVRLSSHPHYQEGIIATRTARRGRSRSLPETPPAPRLRH